MTREDEPVSSRAARGGFRRLATAVVAIAIAMPSASGLSVAADAPASTVTFDDKTLAIIKSGDATRGGALAIQCKACHGHAGVSNAGLMPTLAGMSPLTIYKQLQDFKNDDRPWRDMIQTSRLLSAQDMADLAAYWSKQPGLGKLPSGDESGPGAKLFKEGNAQKGIPPCAACHGPQGNESGAPPLAGQQAAYIQQQLVEFASGLRHNDLDGQMRGIAGLLTPDDFRAVAAYLGGSQP